MDEKLVTALLFSEDFSDVLIARVSADEGKSVIGFPQNVAPAGEDTHYSLPCLAASRAINAALQLDIPVSDWFLAKHTAGRVDEWALYATVSRRVLFRAASNVDGVVPLLPVSAVLSDAWADPSKYSPDFLVLLAAARTQAAERRKSFEY